MSTKETSIDRAASRDNQYAPDAGASDADLRYAPQPPQINSGASLRQRQPEQQQQGYDTAVDMRATSPPPQVMGSQPYAIPSIQDNRRSNESSRHNSAQALRALQQRQQQHQQQQHNMYQNGGSHYDGKRSESPTFEDQLGPANDDVPCGCFCAGVHVQCCASNKATGSKKAVKTDKAFVAFVLLELLFFLLFGLFVEYDEFTEANLGAQTGEELRELYPMYQDIHVMIFIGFGFLMTFLRRNAYTAVGYTFLVGVISIQWTILLRGFWSQVFEQEGYTKMSINIESLINADFGAAAVLISFGAVIGKINPTQLIWMTLAELVFYTLNEAILVEEYHITDVGGSMIIHTFGAFFGLAVTRVLTKTVKKDEKDNKPVYHADLFAMIGTVFLWLYWPSFNAALAGDSGNARHRAVVNTILGLCSSTLITFALTKFYHHNRFCMVDVQNATLAGGVALGGSCNLRMYPLGALIVGGLAGFVSVTGYSLLQPHIKHKLRDTCGILNLHGMPGVIGGLASAVFAGMTSEKDYGEFLKGTLFSAAADRTPSEQAGYQLAALATTLCIAIASGLLVGWLLSLPSLFEQVSSENEFTDGVHWEVPEEEITFFDHRAKEHELDEEVRGSYDANHAL